MIAAEQARFHVQTLLARGVATAVARDQLGVTGVSEIWGGVEPRDKAGWYLWLDERPGAFRIDLEDATPDGSPDRRCACATLSVRHYPAPGSRAFAPLSADERRIVTGGWLDRTGAPDVRHAASIPAAFFLIGALEIAFGDGQVTRALSLGAPERAGEQRPWDVALPLFSALVGLVAQSERRSAVRLVEASGPSHRSAVVIFDASAGCGDALDPYLDPEALVERDELLAPGCARRGHDEGDRRTVRVHPSWFAEGAVVPQQLGCCRS